MYPSRNVLLIGGTGLLGAPTTRALLAAGHHVTVLTRGQRAVHPGAESLLADRLDAGSLASALRGRRFDMTVDFLAYTAADVRRLLDAPELTAGRYVLISTGQVYHLAAQRHPPFAEPAAALPPIPEPEPESRTHGNWVYGMGKREAEGEAERRRGQGLDTVILRLPAVQGAGDVSRRLWAYLQRLLDGGPILLPDGGSIPVRHVWAEDVARLLVALAEGMHTPSPAYNIAMPDEPVLTDLLRRAAAVLGVEPTFVTCTEADLRAAGLEPGLSPFSGPQCSRPDPALAAQELGFLGTPSERWVPEVIRAHLAEADPQDHESYAGRAAERALGMTLAGAGQQRRSP